MSTTNSIKVTAAVLALVATLTLSGCSSDAPATPAVTATTTSATAPVEPVETEPAPVVIKTGDVVTAEPAAALDTMVQRPWTMTDGTIVATTLTEAVPATVVADIAAKGLATFPASTFGANRTQADVDLYPAFETSLDEAGVALGRNIVAVVARRGEPMWTSQIVPFWYVTASNEAYPSRAEAVAAAAAYVASAGGVGNVVVVFDFAA